jgi:hypothetical protein
VCSYPELAAQDRRLAWRVPQLLDVPPVHYLVSMLIFPVDKAGGLLEYEHVHI